MPKENDRNIVSYIRSKLEFLATEHHIKILMAIESGSRAWGFPSADSDYDVRFIYMRSVNDYLSVEDKRDVIETPTLPDPVLGTVMDMNGWDLRKALQLALRSNAVVHEWLTSPVRYIEDKAAIQQLRPFITETADLAAYAYHYDRLARNTYDKILENPTEARLKHYCYVLRPVLSLQWIDAFQNPPPMDMPSLQAGLDIDPVIKSEISRLIIRKSTASEADTMPRSAILDKIIEECLADEKSKSEHSHGQAETDAANKLFQAILNA